VRIPFYNVFSYAQKQQNYCRIFKKIWKSRLLLEEKRSVWSVRGKNKKKRWEGKGERLKEEKLSRLNI